MSTEHQFEMLKKYKLSGGANYELQGQKQIKQMQGHLKNKEENKHLITECVCCTD